MPQFQSAAAPDVNIFTTWKDPLNRLCDPNGLPTMTSPGLSSEVDWDNLRGNLIGSSSETVDSLHIDIDTIPRELPKICQSILSSSLEGNGGTLFASYFLADAVDTNVGTSNATLHNLRIPSRVSTLQHFVNCFVFLSTNNLLGQLQIDDTFKWLVTNIESSILAHLCRLRAPSMRLFARKIFISAVNSGDISLASKLIDSGVNVNIAHVGWGYKKTYLSMAVARGRLPMVELLCKAGATPQVHSSDLSDWETHKSLWDSENLQILRTLLFYGADPECFISDKERGFPLIDAALEGSLGAVNLLLSEGAGVNLYVPSYYGTALQAAASRDHLKLVEALIQFGADVNAPDGIAYHQIRQDFIRTFWYGHKDLTNKRAQQTPLQIAAENDNVSLVQVLLQNRASANACPVSTDARYLLGKIPPYGDPFSALASRYEEEMMFSTAIQYGVQNQNLALVCLLLSVGANVDSRVAPTYGDTPLQRSVRLGNLEITRSLIGAGADLNAPPATFNGRTAIQAAAESGSFQIVRMLLKANADLNAPAGEERGMTALQAAILNGHALMAGFLYAAGAEINAASGCVAGLTALQAAAKRGNSDLLKNLIGLGADVNAPAADDGGQTALQAAVSHKQVSMLEMLVRNGANVNASASLGRSTALQEAACYEWLDGAEYFLECGADVNEIPVPTGDRVEPGLSALGWSILNHDSDMMELLLDSGADVHAAITSEDESPSALCYALRQGNDFQNIGLLLERYGDLSKAWVDEHPLLAAVDGAYDDVGVIRWILKMILEKMAGLPKPSYDDEIRKAWHKLSSGWRGRGLTLEILDVLLKAGADINSQDDDTGETLLQEMISPMPDAATFLLNNGADINTPATLRTGTPLQEAIKRERIEIVNLLLERGADVNAPPAVNYGVTALQAAAIRGLTQVAVQLLQRGADVTAAAAPFDGRTAIDGAAEHGRWDMLQLLLNAYEGQEDLRVVCGKAAAYAEKEGHIEIAQWLRGYPHL
jgi:ankyrin repeat protein